LLIIDLIIDIEIYTAMINNSELTLGMFPSIASGRWTWLCDNWVSYKSKFTTATEGEIYYQQLIQDLNTEVITFQLGNRNNPFENDSKFKNYKDLLDLILLSEINPTPLEKSIRDEVLRVVSAYPVEQFEIMFNFVKKTSSQIAIDIGLGDEDAAKLLGLSISRKKREPSISDLTFMDSLIDLQELISTYIFNLKRIEKKPPNLLAIANRNLDISTGIGVDEGFVSSVPVPFEISLEHMASKYLGSKDYWFELVTINNLQPPFVDNVGVKIPILSPASQTSVLVSNNYKHLIHPSTIMRLGSDRQKEFNVIVEKIYKNDENNMVLSFNTNKLASLIRPNENGYIRVYAPNTIRKNSMILIPSKNMIDTGSDKTTPSSSELRNLEQAYINFGIDIYKDAHTGDFKG